MARRPCTFTQSALVRAVKAAKVAGLDIARVEIEHDGKIVLVLSGTAAAEVTTLNPFIAAIRKG